ncbi:MAG: trehalose-6-phosphate synthase [candidate division Zixibacteria bacterium SM23_73_3]|nr:MAG: trehalose-6-phosphate synthase [candidate division Zixibacteria bacterium SM23_73_3]
MGRLLIVSNRLPMNVAKKEGCLRFQPSAGGVATGLSSFYKSYQSLWIGWPGITLEKIRLDEIEKIGKKLLAEDCYPVFLSQHDAENYYYGFCNKTVWPLFHHFPLFTSYNKSFWETYKRVNYTFCDALVKAAEPEDIIWVHDYQLMLLPGLIREKLPDASIGFFLHIPFPSFEVFRLLPWRKEIIEGFLGADLIGFHTNDYVLHFLDSVHRLLGYEHAFGQINAGSRVTKVDVFPMGIDYKRFASAVDDPEVQKGIQRIRKKMGDRRIILSIDRLDYTKGIVQRLEAFDLFLENNPQYKEKVTFILVAVPSRTGVEHYAQLKNRVDELVGKINGKHGTIGWVPIWYLYRFQPFHSLVALYNVADAALVTPMRDGMNLIAKEFVATKADGKGVLILSEMAGASKELGEAIIVNPNNLEEVAQALKEALTMPREEQIERNRIMQKRLQRYNVVRWGTDFVDALSNIKKIQMELSVRKLIPETQKKLIRNYQESDNNIILLDYDGTLVPFTDKPQKAKPDEELLSTLDSLGSNPKNEVVIVSGRDKDTLDRWFGNEKLNLTAEHGVWIKDRGKPWGTIEPLRDNWKEQIRPFVEWYEDRTPGSFIEEKDFSLVWHYRKVEPQLASLRARELKDALLQLTANLNLGVLEGSKVIEIKSVGINKGRAALHWLSKNTWDFILAIGDDWTDEDLFAILPESAYSIKVGLSPSKAKFNLDSVEQVRSLLKELVGR